MGTTEDHRESVWRKAGIGLLGLSLALWVPLPAVPFLPLSSGAKAALGGGLIAGAEIAFWVGAILAGPEAARRTRWWLLLRRKKRGDSG